MIPAGHRYADGVHTRAWERIVFCPHPPLLIPGLSGARLPPELVEVDEAARSAIRWLLEGVDRVSVIGTALSTQRYPAGQLASTSAFGPSTEFLLGRGEPVRPANRNVATSLLVAASLLAEPRPDAAYWAVADGLSQQECSSIGADACAAGGGRLLLMADGSARRRDGAPGYIDSRAVPFDDHLAEVLAAGSASGLSDLDGQVAAELLVAGVAPWQIAAEVVGTGAVTAHLDLYSAPYGVGYFVARWS